MSNKDNNDLEQAQKDLEEAHFLKALAAHCVDELRGYGLPVDGLMLVCARSDGTARSVAATRTGMTLTELPEHQRTMRAAIALTLEHYPDPDAQPQWRSPGYSKRKRRLV